MGSNKDFFREVLWGSTLSFKKGSNASLARPRVPLIIFSIKHKLKEHTVFFSDYVEDNTAHKNIQFDLLSGALPEYLLTPQIIPLANAKDVLEPFFRHQDTHLFYRLSCLYHFLWQVENCCSGLPVKYKRLFPALTAMSENSSASAPIAYYSDLCGMSEVNFRRLFKEHTGKTPIEYRNDLRLEDAKCRIESGEYNVSEAAEASGFVNLSFFSRLYKKKYGHTPKQT